MIYIDAGADLNADEPRWTSTASLQAGSTYVAVNTEGDNRAGFEVTPFTVGTTPNGATAPRADATVTMVDLRFTGASTLPRNGTIRFRNNGWAPHFAIAAPLRSGATSAQIGDALRSRSSAQARPAAGLRQRRRAAGAHHPRRGRGQPGPLPEGRQAGR